MPTFFSPLIENAIRLSNYWHQGQDRKGSEFDYFTHPVAVALILARAGFDDGVIAAGLCHDLLEDTDCPAEEILEAVGPRVLHIVETVTENTDLDLNDQWEQRKKQYIEAVRQGSIEAKAVCVADKIHNLKTLIASLEEIGMDYFNYFHRGAEEKLWFEDHVCVMLQETWSHPLVDEYNTLVDQFVDVLERLDADKELLPVNPTGGMSAPKSDYDEPVESEEIADEEEQAPYIPSLKSKDVYTLPDRDYTVLHRPKEKKRNTVSSQSIKLPKKRNMPSTPKLGNAKVSRKESIYGGKYLSDSEVELLLPAVLQLGITHGTLTNRMLQESLKVPYTTAFKILKELKRLHIIKQADSFKPRKVNIKEAKEILSALIG